jgi:predicted nucleic acid-binding Zn ribbon protein
VPDEELAGQLPPGGQAGGQARSGRPGRGGSAPPDVPGESATDRAERAARALARAKADARARGVRPPQPGRRALGAAGDAAPSGTAGRAGPAGAGGGQRGTGSARSRGARIRRDDPEPLSSAIGGLLAERDWRSAAAIGSVFGRWERIVGADLAAHVRPDTFTEGELVVAADSTAWATQVRLLAPSLVRRLNEELGHTTVTRVVVRGPTPPPATGRWRVRGGRGPRDDYG